MELSPEQKQLIDVLDSCYKNYAKFVPSFAKDMSPDQGWNENKFTDDIAKLKDYIARPPAVVVRSSSGRTSCSQCTRYKAKVLRLEEERKKQASYLAITESALAFGDSQNTK